MITSSVPLLVEPTAFQTFLTNQDSLRADDRVYTAGDPTQVELYANVAYLPMMGVFNLPRERYYERDVTDVMKQLRNIQADSTVNTVLMHFRSPGGYAVGQLELTALMREMKEGGITFYAFSDQMCFSYAYHVASECDYLIGTPTSRWGSISGMLYLTDYSKMFAASGMEIVGHSTGTMKAIGTPGLPITPEQREELKRRVEPSSDDFKAQVKERRGLSDDLMQGQVWRAKDAPAGVIDAQVNTLEDLLASLID